MRMRRAQDKAACFVRLPDIVDIAAPALEEAQILFSAHRLPDRLHTHLSPPSPLTPSAAGADSGKAVPEARPETAAETMRKAAGKAVLEMAEPLHDDDRRREAKVPGRADPIREKFGIDVIDGV